MRKNFILWWRTPACSIFEILAPIALMAILWIIRLQVPSTSVTQEGLYSKKYTTFKGINNVDGVYNVDYDDLNPYLQPMFSFADYYNRHDGPDEPYEVSWDYNSPQFWAPTHCI